MAMHKILAVALPSTVLQVCLFANGFTNCGLQQTPPWIPAKQRHPAQGLECLGPVVGVEEDRR